MTQDLAEGRGEEIAGLEVRVEADRAKERTTTNLLLRRSHPGREVGESHPERGHRAEPGDPEAMNTTTISEIPVGEEEDETKPIDRQAHHHWIVKMMVLVHAP